MHVLGSTTENMVVLWIRAGAPRSISPVDIDLFMSGIEVPEWANRQMLDDLQGMVDQMADGRTFPCPNGITGSGFDDIRRGAQVVVRDEEGTILATSRLRGGTFTLEGCSFDFAVDVPPRPFYEIEVAHRGSITYSAKRLDRNGWHIVMSLGSGAD